MDSVTAITFLWPMNGPLSDFFRVRNKINIMWLLRATLNVMLIGTSIDLKFCFYIN